MDPISIKTFEYTCSKKSIQLLELAIEENQLPERWYHTWVFLKTCAFEVISIAGRVASIVGNIFDILAIPCSRNIKAKKNRLYFGIYRLVLFDLSNVLCGIAVAIIRIFSSLLGIAKPIWAAKGWRVAEQIEVFRLRIVANVWNKLGLFGAEDQKMEELDPVTAKQYLGEDAAKRVATSHILEARQKELDTLIPQSLEDLFQELENVNDGGDLRYALNHSSDEKVPEVLQCLVYQTDDSFADIHSRIKDITNDQIQTLFTHLKTLSMWKEPTEDEEVGQPKKMKRVAKLTEDVAKSLQQQADILEGQLSERLRFGCVPVH